MDIEQDFQTDTILLCSPFAWKNVTGDTGQLGRLGDALMGVSRGFEVAGLVYDFSLRLTPSSGFTIGSSELAAPVHVAIYLDRMDQIGAPIGFFWNPFTPADFPVGATPNNETDRPARLLRRHYCVLSVTSAATAGTGELLAYDGVADTHFRSQRLGIKKLIPDDWVLAVNVQSQPDPIISTLESYFINWSMAGSLYYRWRT